MERFRIRALAMGLAALYACLGARPAACEPQKFTPRQLQQDFDTLLDVVATKHPDATHSASPAVLRKALADVRRQLNHPMSQDEAWRTFATLNPVFADGHFLVALPNWRGMTKEHLEQGGSLFPFEVYVEPTGHVFIRSQLGGEASPLVRAEIETINGVKAREIARHLLTLVHSDTLKIRADLLSQRWWLFYWKVYGEPRDFHLETSQGRSPAVGTVVAGSHELPLVLQIEGQLRARIPFRVATEPCRAVEHRRVWLGQQTALLRLHSRCLCQNA